MNGCGGSRKRAVKAREALCVRCCLLWSRKGAHVGNYPYSKGGQQLMVRDRMILQDRLYVIVSIRHRVMKKRVVQTGVNASNRPRKCLERCMHKAEDINTRRLGNRRGIAILYRVGQKNAPACDGQPGLSTFRRLALGPGFTHSHPGWHPLQSRLSFHRFSIGSLFFLIKCYLIVKPGIVVVSAAAYCN